MRVLIVSDTHGRDGNFYEVLNKEGNPDFLIHAGDTAGNEEQLKDSVRCPVKIVLGNNDYNPNYKYEEEFEIAGHRILLVHGHREGVYMGTDRLFYKAMSCGADVVIYGHTHVPSIEYDETSGIYAVNPGSLSLPRQTGHLPSYIIMEINDKDEVEFRLNFLTN